MFLGEYEFGLHRLGWRLYHDLIYTPMHQNASERGDDKKVKHDGSAATGVGMFCIKTCMGRSVGLEIAWIGHSVVIADPWRASGR